MHQLLPPLADKSIHQHGLLPLSLSRIPITIWLLTICFTCKVHYPQLSTLPAQLLSTNNGCHSQAQAEAACLAALAAANFIGRATLLPPGASWGGNQTWLRINVVGMMMECSLAPKRYMDSLLSGERGDQYKLKKVRAVWTDELHKGPMDLF